MALLLEQFIANLTASGLVSNDEIEAALASLPPGQRSETEALSACLVHSGRLTRFQARSIYRGRTAFLVVGEYLLLDQIGEGGMGCVYMARHRTLDRVVAFKVLNRELAGNPDFVKRFEREMRAVGRLSHPNIVQAYDAGEHRGRLYLAMEYIHGMDLGARLKSHGPFGMSRVVDYVLQTARGLEYAHREGVVHRDVKPANLMLDPEGTVKILDFGLATLEQGNAASSYLTRTGNIMGSIDFMSPEQLSSNREADQRTDIYALGCVLHLLLTGRPVYPGASSAAKAAGHIHEEVPSLRSILPSVPVRLDEIFRTMLAKNPNERYQEMSHVRSDLADVVIDPNADESQTLVIVDKPRNRAGEEADATVVEFHGAPPCGTSGAELRPHLRPAQPHTLTRRWNRRAVVWALGAVVLTLGGAAFWSHLGDFRLAEHVAGAPGRPGPNDPSTSPAPNAGDSPGPHKVLPILPDAEPSPLLVFVLAGQSNMSGKGMIGDLAKLVQDQPATYGHLQTADGNWKTRDDVWIVNSTNGQVRSGALTVGFGLEPEQFGPELGFGAVVGDALAEPVLLIKVSQKNLALAQRGRPPDSGGEVGAYYQDLVSQVDAVTKNPESWIPELAGRRCRLAGLVWFQGWNDAIYSRFMDEYEENLRNLIQDLRAAWKAPQLPVVIGELGQDGVIDLSSIEDPNERVRALRAVRMRDIQRTVAELPEFQGTVRLVETSPFVRPGPGPTDGYNHSAESFYLIGDAFGRAMLDLLQHETAHK